MKFCCVTITALLVGGALSVAEEPLVLSGARKALREGVPQVAAQKLRAALENPNLSGEERSSAIRLLTEALISGGQPEEALSQLEQFHDEHSETALLRARALFALRRWAEALPIFEAITSKPQPPPIASLGRAECLAVLGRQSDAASVLRKMVDEGNAGNAERLRLAELYTELKQLAPARELLTRTKPATRAETHWRAYVEGCLYLAEKLPLPARDIFDKLLREPSYLTERLVFGATLGLADATVELSGNEPAAEVLERFIYDFPQSAYLEAAFRRLDQIYSEEDDPSASDLDKWAQQAPPRRAALATFYFAKHRIRERKYEKAGDLLKRFVQNYPSHSLVCEAYLMQADLFLMKQKLAQAIPALEAAMRLASNADQRGEIELRTAIVHHQQGEYLLAANLFRSAAERSPRLGTVATYNAALSWLNQRSDVPYAAELRKLEDQPHSASLSPELLLEQGLIQARAGEARAEETLQLFLHRYPKNPRAAEARIALAELEFQALQSSANPQRRSQSAQQASAYLRVANSEPRTPEMAEHADYLAVFLADVEPPKSDAKVLEVGEEFLRRYKKSQFVSDIRMKLGQVYFRREDFANAETQFATLAEEAPESQYAETALFLAGQSAMKLARNPGALDRALGFFNAVVKRGGPLLLYARQEQAIAQSRVGHDVEAIFLYDLILSAQPSAGPELRFAALCGKGDSLRTLGRSDPERLENAIAVFDQLAQSPNVTPSWRNQALYKKAKALEQLGKSPEALAAFYDVLERSSAAEREHFWSGKAGFDAGRILEQQEQWKAAIAIYEKLAKLEGPRAGEARQRVTEIRLKYFVWE